MFAARPASCSGRRAPAGRGAGDIKSPLLRGGGVVFGPDDRNYQRKANKKVRRLALKMALSSKLADRALTVLDGFDLAQIKTRGFVAVMRNLGLESALIVTAADDPRLELSARNVPGVRILRAEGLNVYDVLKFRHLVLLEPSVKQIEGRLS